ncbi:GNAT family N-acetyltransferase [Clostridium aminobutyricum]|uniref:GNAT family N-acetyltransferase n=1 Tax=Clostridium aminobutyricum TaxID=33953 RepID=A0A939D7D6_CLOAM|nr:GNAT family protein [Clostridium aminobutyricum]MBN7772577.1 GNAT family N-acetyltransferase [Clostridium aminobutyricum]
MESKNIIIRKTVFEDCYLFAEWEIMSEVTEFFSMNSDRCYEDVVREFVRRELDKTKLQFTICEKNELPIGRIYISKVDRDNDSLDITRIYIADGENRRKGFGEEALRLILEYCFMNLHTERVTLSYFEGNKVASGLCEKLGFKHEGLARNACKKNGKYHDLHLLSLLRAEYYVKIHDR